MSSQELSLQVQDEMPEKMSEATLLKDDSYRRPFWFSISLHALVLIFLLVSIKFSPSTTPWTDKNKADQDIIQAVTVNSAAVQQQVQQIKAAETQKQQQQQAQLKAIADQTAALKKQQQAAAAAAKAQLNKLQQEQAIAQQKLAQVQQQQLLAQQQAQAAAQKLKQQQAAEQAAAAAQAKKLAQQKKQQQAAAAAQAAAQQKQEQLEQQFQQQVTAEQAKLAAARNQQIQSEVDHYKALIVNAISQQWVVPDGTNPELACQLLINLAPGGVVLNVTVTKSSGNSGLDQSAVTAVYKASPLPTPSDPTLFDQFRQLSLTVKPEQINQG